MNAYCDNVGRRCLGFASWILYLAVNMLGRLAVPKAALLRVKGHLSAIQTKENAL
jgi:hypothetical protein